MKSAPASASSSVWPSRSTPMTRPKPAERPRRRPGNPRRPRPGPARRPTGARPPATRRGPACLQVEFDGGVAIHPGVEQTGDTGRDQDGFQFRLEVTTAVFRPSSRSSRNQATEPGTLRPPHRAEPPRGSPACGSPCPTPTIPWEGILDPGAGRFRGKRGNPSRPPAVACRPTNPDNPRQRKNERSRSRFESQASRNSSNVRFQAPACMRAVVVSTPSRSNRTASKRSGSTIPPLGSTPESLFIGGVIKRLTHPGYDIGSRARARLDGN